MTHPRLPLVLGATQTATDQAARLLPAGAQLENLVLGAIASGRMFARSRKTGTARVHLPAHGLVVDVARVPSPSGRGAWRPLRLYREGRR
jgi:hypothetical protein